MSPQKSRTGGAPLRKVTVRSVLAKEGAPCDAGETLTELDPDEEGEAAETAS